MTGSASEALFAVSISGVVTSAQGPIVGATVKLGGSVTETAVSGPGGAYTFSNLPLNGSYQVSVAPMTNCSCGSPIELSYLRHSVSGEDFTMTGSGCGGAASDGGANEASALQCSVCPAGPQGVAGPEGPAGPPSKIDSLVGDAAALPQLANATSAANFCVVGQNPALPVRSADHGPPGSERTGVAHRDERHPVLALRNDVRRRRGHHVRAAEPHRGGSEQHGILRLRERGLSVATDGSRRHRLAKAYIGTP